MLDKILGGAVDMIGKLADNPLVQMAANMFFPGAGAALNMAADSGLFSEIADLVGGGADY